MSAEMLLYIGLLLGAGIFAGLAGGLFGIGGGIIMVPVLFIMFGAMGVPEAAQLQLAIGTSLAVIIVTSARALATHHKLGAVDWPIWRRWVPWIALGAGGAGFIARYLPTQILLTVFTLGALFIGYNRLTGKQVTASPDGRAQDGVEEPASELASDRAAKKQKITMQFAPILGTLTGLFSSLLGLGGGVAGVLVMSWSGRPMHRAVATASGFGLGVAIPGVIGFAIAGQGVAGLPWASIGYVSVPAFCVPAMVTAITAPIGARLAHRVSAQLLSRGFGVYVLIMAIFMVIEAIS